MSPTFSKPNRSASFIDGSLAGAMIAQIGVGFKSIGLDNIKFITVPIEYDQREEYRGRVDWVQPAAKNLWKLIADDKPLPESLRREACRRNAEAHASPAHHADQRRQTH